MRWMLAVGCVLAMAGCWNPKVTSGGFACSPTDDPPCPSGFYCVGGLCLDHPGAPGGLEGGVGGGGVVGDGGGGGADLSLPGGPADLSLPPSDLSAPLDMAAPPDMACYPPGHACHFKKKCCAQCCYGCTLFGYCGL